MNLLKTTARCAIALAVLAPPTFASAQNGYYDNSGHHHRTYHRTYARNYARDDYGRRTCGAQKRAHGNNGTAIGAVSGGVLGSALGDGKVTNILLGAGAGAVAGHAIGRGTVHC